MIRLDGERTQDAWGHDGYARGGAHALADEDIDAALAFFSRAKERLPLDPPLPMHRPMRHPRDAGSDDDGSQEASASVAATNAAPTRDDADGQAGDAER